MYVVLGLDSISITRCLNIFYNGYEGISGIARKNYVYAGGATIETPKTPSGVRSGEGVPSPANQGVWGSVVSSPSKVHGKAQPQTHFLHILGHILMQNL